MCRDPRAGAPGVDPHLRGAGVMEQDFEQVAVISPADAKALKGDKTDAEDPPGAA